jgi:acetolactate synthase-1/2/3 large subunit
LGGGTLDAAEEARALVEVLDAPVAVSIRAKGVIPGGHPLLLGANIGFAPVREAIEAADVVLAIGTELSESDRFPDTRDLQLEGKLIRVDLDADQTTTGYFAQLAIVSDARAAMRALHEALCKRIAVPRGDAEGARRAALLREATRQLWAPEIQNHSRALDTLQAALPDLLLVGDSAQPAYSAHYCFDPPRPRSFWSSATGFGALGYALPAAIGAKLAFPDRPVVSLIGDGGLQFTLPEFATAVEAAAPIIILLWNNQGYEEIRRQMNARGILPMGTDLLAPDFVTVAQAYGLTAARASDLGQLRALLLEARESSEPTLIEIDEADWRSED